LLTPLRRRIGWPEQEGRRQPSGLEQEYSAQLGSAAHATARRARQSVAMQTNLPAAPDTITRSPAHYNAHAAPYSRSLGTHFLQYDHVGHAYASFVIAFACWVMLAAPHAAGGHRRELVILSVGTALGLGAVNEVVEFTATLAHHGAHAGGYWNTGWDLVCNLIGATAAGIVIATSRAGAA
jgi:hypothetical protein